jgi:hypothetical protein
MTVHACRITDCTGSGGGVSDLSGQAALTFHQVVAPHDARSDAASTRWGQSNTAKPRLGAAQTQSRAHFGRLYSYQRTW